MPNGLLYWHGTAAVAQYLSEKNHEKGLFDLESVQRPTNFDRCWLSCAKLPNSPFFSAISHHIAFLKDSVPTDNSNAVSKPFTGIKWLWLETLEVLIGIRRFSSVESFSEIFFSNRGVRQILVSNEVLWRLHHSKRLLNEFVTVLFLNTKFSDEI